MKIKLNKYTMYAVGGSTYPPEVAEKVREFAAKNNTDVSKVKVWQEGNTWYWSYGEKSGEYLPTGTTPVDLDKKEAFVGNCKEKLAGLAKYFDNEELKNQDIQKGIIVQGRVNGVLAVWYPSAKECPLEVREYVEKERTDKGELTLAPKTNCFTYSGGSIFFNIKAETNIGQDQYQRDKYDKSNYITLRVDFPQGSTCDFQGVSISQTSAADGAGKGEELHLRTTREETENIELLIRNHKDFIINKAIDTGIFNDKITPQGNPNSTTIGTEGTDDKIDMGNIPQEGFSLGGLINQYRKFKKGGKVLDLKKAGGKIKGKQKKLQEEILKKGGKTPKKYEYMGKGGLKTATQYKNKI